MNRKYERRLLKFTKDGKMRYIGHLDLMKIFQTAIRRSRLPIAYSMGFNPHQRISFAMPLPVGVESICEHVELLLDKPADIMVLKNFLPNRLVPLTGWDIPENAQSPTAAAAAADYRIETEEAADIENRINEITASREVLILKKTKKGEAMVDIKPNIVDLKYSGGGFVTMRIMGNLNPYHVARLFCENINKLKIIRTEMYGFKQASDENKLVPLHEAVIG